jgi:hypothetical protein
MVHIAKETLVYGFTPVANPGTIVSDELVQEMGWQDKVDTVKGEVGGGGDATEDATPDATKTAKATKSTKS